MARRPPRRGAGPRDHAPAPACRQCRRSLQGDQGERHPADQNLVHDPDPHLLEKTSVFHLVNRRSRNVAEHFAGNREPDPFPLRVRDYGNFSLCTSVVRRAAWPSAHQKSRRRDSARMDCASSIAIGHQWAGSSARLLRETGSPTGVPRPSKSPLLRFNSERRLRNVPHRKFQARQLPSSSVGFETFPNRSISRSALLAFVRIDRSERGEYRTLSADRRGVRGRTARPRPRLVSSRSARAARS